MGADGSNVLDFPPQISPSFDVHSQRRTAAIGLEVPYFFVGLLTRERPEQPHHLLVYTMIAGNVWTIVQPLASGLWKPITVRLRKELGSTVRLLVLLLTWTSRAGDVRVTALLMGNIPNTGADVQNVVHPLASGLWKPIMVLVETTLVFMRPIPLISGL